MYLENITEELLCTKRFDEGEIKTLKTGVTHNYIAEFWIDHVDFYDYVGLMWDEIPMLKTSTVFEVFYNKRNEASETQSHSSFQFPLFTFRSFTLMRTIKMERGCVLIL
jgi:hypothetical protein